MNKVFELFPGAKLGIAAFTLCLTAASVTAAKPKPPPTLSSVFLGSATTFAVFGASGVSSTGKTVINGDLGVYPVAGTAVTGFSGENAGGPGVVNGTIQDTDTALETTAGLNAAASLGIAIIDAAGRTGPCPCSAANTNLAGLTLTPGLYKADTTLKISGGTLYLSGKGVYIFQIGTQLLVTNATVVLENGAVAADIFWQVGTSAILTTVPAFEGTILAGAQITMTKGTTLVGRALSQKAVTFITDTVTRP
jgi:hypothetical protein